MRLSREFSYEIEAERGDGQDLSVNRLVQISYLRYWPIQLHCCLTTHLVQETCQQRRNTFLSFEVSCRSASPAQELSYDTRIEIVQFQIQELWLKSIGNALLLQFACCGTDNNVNPVVSISNDSDGL